MTLTLSLSFIRSKRLETRPTRPTCRNRRHLRALPRALEQLEGRQLLSTLSHVTDPSPVVSPPTVTYADSSQVAIQPITFWQGIRGSSQKGDDLIVGTSLNQGLLYVGPISGQGGRAYHVDVPGAISTSVYGPDNLGGNKVRLVGVYHAPSDPSVVQGFVYQGKISVAAFANPKNYHTIDYPGTTYNYIHSTDGDLVVGNEDSRLLTTGQPVQAHIENLTNGRFTPIAYPGAASTTAYGIIHNGSPSYTITGGYALPDSSTGSPNPGAGFLVDYNASTGQFSHWTPIVSPLQQAEGNVATHVEGISLVKKGVYTLSADAIPIGAADAGQGYFVTVHRNRDGSFSTPSFVPLNVPGATKTTSANSVFDNQVVGITLGQNSAAYQATVSGRS